MDDVVPNGEHFSRNQLLLMEIRDKVCGGNAAQLARAIGKDATYVNRLFYPESKPGRKGIGLEIMQAVSRAFFLPMNFWELTPPALDDEAVEAVQSKVAAREVFERGFAMGELHHIRTSGANAPLAVIDGRVRLPAIYMAPHHGSQHLVAERVANKLIGGMQQIRAWEHEGDLPEGDYAMVPRLSVKLSAGPGSGANQLAFDFDDGELRAYSAEWIRRHRLKPNKLRVMKGHGRSMEPTIFDGDDLLINLAETEVVDGKVYALWYDGGERVKRLYRMPGGGLRIRSDNERDFPEIVLGPDYTGHVRIIGRVIDRSGPGGL